MYNADLWLLTYEKELADELGTEPAFDSTVTRKPAGAEVQDIASDFEQSPGDMAAIEQIPGLEEPV